MKPFTELEAIVPEPPGKTAALAPDPGALTYEPHFGLKEKPFSLSSDPRFFFRESSHGVSFDALTAGIRRREGILALMGEVGTGKTTLCRAVLQALDRRTFAAFVPDPFLSREDLLKTLLVDFGVISVDEIRAGRLRGASRTDLSYPLYDFLASLQPLKADAVVMIDEAHNLTTELLEEIRILSDLEKSSQKLLGVMLIGQPELQMRLASTEMRQLTQRVSLRCELAPLVLEEVKAYISHRLTIAGNDDGRVQFTAEAAECVATASNGIPRVVNLVCDRALLRAASSGASIVNAEHVVWAATDLRMPVPHLSALTPNPIEARPALPIDTPYLAVDVARPIESDPLELETPVPAFVAEAEEISEDLQESPPHWRWPAVTAVCVVLIAAAGVWLTRHSLGWPGDRHASVVPKVAAQTVTPLSTPAPADLQTTSQASLTPTIVENMSAPAPKVALQMATFQSSTRTEQAIQELRNAGYQAYSVELSPQGGERVLAVLLGPYSDVSSAERDLERARELPGYETARLVQMVPALLPHDALR